MTHTNRPILLNWPATGEHPNQRPFDCRLALKLEASNPFEPPESTKAKTGYGRRAKISLIRFDLV